MQTDPRIDAYIAKAATFAQPILRHLRALVQRSLPEAEETIKWGMPHWTVGGKNVAGMAAFKGHCSFVIHGEGRQASRSDEGMGQFGKIAALTDLPPDEVLAEKLQDAVRRIASEGTAAKTSAGRKAKPEIPMPGDLTSALASNPQAQATFDAFSPSHRREYLEWITEAKRDETRARRVSQAIEWLAEGKKRNWKYEKC